MPFTVRMMPLGFTTSRLRGISVDEDGYVWIGTGEADHSVLVCHLPTGECRKVSMDLGEFEKIDTLIPIGEKIYVCGTDFPRQIIYNRKTGEYVEKALARDDPVIWYGLAVGPHAYLFDYNHGLYRWDAGDESCEFYPYTLGNHAPHSGVYVPQKEALYCAAWWTDGMPATVLTKFDLRRQEFTAEFAPPWEGARPLGHQLVGDTIYCADMFGGTMMLFDVRSERWIARYELPGYEQGWKYACPQTTLGRYVLCGLSTFQGVRNASGSFGFDGKRHHFVNHVLVFDTRDGSAGLMEVPSLSGQGYATIAYMSTHGERLYGTCVDATAVEDGGPSERGPAYLAEFTLSDDARRTVGAGEIGDAGFVPVSDPSARLKGLPHVEKYGSTPLYLKDPQGRMKRSDWNYFFLDQKSRVLAGYWEAESGSEELGEDSFHELLHVISGRLYVEAEGRVHVAEPGDTVIVVPGRKCRVRVEEPVRVLFFCCPVEDPMGYERAVLEMMAGSVKEIRP